MNKLLVATAAALAFVAFVPDDASAQRRGAGISMGGVRGASIGVRGGGFRGAAIGMRGSGIRSVGIRTGGWSGGRVVARGGPVWGARRAAWGGGGPAWGARRAAWGGGPWVGRRVAWGGWRPGWRRSWGWGGWGFPVAAGLAFAAASSYGYYDSCWRWNGFQWVNVCYAPAAYSVSVGYGGGYWW